MPQHHLVVQDTVQAHWVITIGGSTLTWTTATIVPTNFQVTPSAANALFDSVKALWAANIAALVPSSTVLSKVQLRDVRSEGLALVDSNTSSVPGTATPGETLPKQIAAVITLRTNRAGRKYRGRFYLGGFAETANDSTNHMTAACKAALDAFAAGFISAYNVGGTALGVMHRPTSFDEVTGLPIAPGLGFTTPVTLVVCRDNVWDTQRRRAS